MDEPVIEDKTNYILQDFSIFGYQGFVMLTAIKGYYEKGKIILQEEAPVKSKTDVIVTFLSEDINGSNGKRIPGSLKGKVSIPDDFDAPLDDLKDYM